VWSVGCATGEEAYTLAMLAADAFHTAAPPVTVLGTDISASAVERARAGRYGLRRASGVPPAQRARYLELDGDWVVVRPNLGSLVRFARHNLVADAAPPPGEEPFDLVVCRNVLIYFDPPTAERVAGSLRGALRGSGQLLLGAADQLGRVTRSPAAAGGHALPVLAPRDRLARAVAAADAGLADEALAEVDLLLAADPLNAGGHFLRGLVELPRDARAAVDSLRRALLVDPRLGLAAFQLGRALDALGEKGAAREAYERALHTLDPEDMRYDELLGQVDLGDVAAAIRVRMEDLR
jgi:tetratricopeptide (TPR) repeat protein